MKNELAIIEKLRSLPPEKRSEALDFIEFLHQRNHVQKSLRPHGLSKEKFNVPEGFDEPLPEEILRDFGV